MMITGNSQIRRVDVMRKYKNSSVSTHTHIYIYIHYIYVYVYIYIQVYLLLCIIKNFVYIVLHTR